MNVLRHRRQACRSSDRVRQVKPNGLGLEVTREETLNVDYSPLSFNAKPHIGGRVRTPISSRARPQGLAYWGKAKARPQECKPQDSSEGPPGEAVLPWLPVSERLRDSPLCE